jgi:hypothetical protein
VLPDDFSFPDLGKVRNNSLVPLGPKSSVSAGLIVLSNDEMIAIQEGRRFFYVWGWSKYYDIFGSEHMTKFCYRLKTVIGDLRSPVKGTEIGVVWDFHHQHNTAD